MVTLLYIVLILVLVFANGFFVASEFALVGVRRSRVETLAALGNANAQRLLGLLDNLNAYISATQGYYHGIPRARMDRGASLRSFT